MEASVLKRNLLLVGCDLLGVDLTRKAEGDEGLSEFLRIYLGEGNASGQPV